MSRPAPGGLTEEDVGIVELATKLPGFSAILKHRYRDFQVREVDLQGRVAQLTSLQYEEAEHGAAALPPFTPEGLAAAQSGIVAAFTQLAGAANGQLLEQLLTRVSASLSSSKVEEDAAAAGDGASTAAAGAAAAGAGQVESGAEEAPKQAATQEAGCGASAAGQEAGSGGSGSGSGSAPSVQLGPGGRISVVLHHISSKDVRRAAHDFFRSTPGLPPLRTETVAVLPPSTAAAPPVGAAGAEGGGQDGDSATERPSKRAKVEERRQPGPKGGRGRHGQQGRGQPPQQPQDTSSTLPCIEVAFHPQDLQAAGGAGGARGQRQGERDGGRGRGGRGGGGGRGGRGGGGDWAGGANKFLRFVLYKENMDTQVALNLLGRMAGLAKSNCFGFAGTKDKRGVTTQYVTAFKVAPQRLDALNPRLRGLRVGNFEYCDAGLKLGALGGNEFHLLMRDVTGSSVQQIAAACDAVSSSGFINYFGLQRFGAGGSPTHVVGKALLRGEYEAAVRLVLTGRPDERPDVAAARKLYLDKGDIQGALRGLPHFLLGERAVLGGLARHGASAWSAALLGVPRTLRMMYLHAWQSYVWNVAASHRVSRYGTDRAVAGDLVMPRAEAGGGLALEGDAAVDAEGEAGAVPEDTDAAGAEASASGPGTHASSAARLSAARKVTEEDAAAGRYSVFDVVLPLPGTRVLYPEHETGERIRQAALEAGVDLDDPPAASSGKGGVGSPTHELSFASLTGDYRYLLHRPRSLSYSLRRYTDPNDDSLVPTDLELLLRGGAGQAGPGAGAAQGGVSEQGQPHQPAGAATDSTAEGGAGQGPGGKAVAVCGEGPRLALDLRFQLPSSCYATMLLREVMKSSTSRGHHAGLSAAQGGGGGGEGEGGGEGAGADGEGAKEGAAGAAEEAAADASLGGQAGGGDDAMDA